MEKIIITRNESQHQFTKMTEIKCKNGDMQKLIPNTVHNIEMFFHHFFIYINKT